MGMTEERMGMIVSDAGPIIHLDELQCLTLLEDFGEIAIPQAVYEEIILHRKTCITITNMNFVKHTTRLPFDERLLTMSQVFSLHAGEMEALAINGGSSRSTLSDR